MKQLLEKKTHFVVVTGGVISGVGKGVTTASLGKILQEYGYTVTIIKIDPYINVDAGTLRPTEHGEVWVTDDGGEIDQDLGTYERFLNRSILKKNGITTGQVYKEVIDRERNGGYLGHTVQFIPHITGEISRRIIAAADDFEIVIIEIGGTVGDHENIPFLFAIKALERQLGAQQFAHILVSYLPVPGHIFEMKTKPTQQAIRLLCEQGIMPDFIVCRSKVSLDDVRRKKIEEYAHIASGNVIAAPDVESVYEVPLIFQKQQFGEKLLAHFGLQKKKEADFTLWQSLVNNMLPSTHRVLKIAIVGKYTTTGSYELIDSYLSVHHALLHAGAALGVNVEIVWLSSHTLENTQEHEKLFEGVDGILVPGGFGSQGVEGKIKAIQYAREQNVPFLGICYGFQLAVVEFARHICGRVLAHTMEVNQETPDPVIITMPEQVAMIQNERYGGTMRLGAYEAFLEPKSIIGQLYANSGIGYYDIQKDMWVVCERHRHRYEVNPDYITLLESKGLHFSGYHYGLHDIRLAEFLELPDHRYFVATQAHPEFTSRLESPNPLFYGFIAACNE